MEDGWMDGWTFTLSRSAATVVNATTLGKLTTCKDKTREVEEDFISIHLFSIAAAFVFWVARFGVRRYNLNN